MTTPAPTPPTPVIAPVRLVLPGLLRDLVGGLAEISVPVGAAGGTVAEVLDRAFADHPVLRQKVRDERGQIRRHVKVFVDGSDATRAQGVDTPVPAGATVHVINAVSGG